MRKILNFIKPKDKTRLAEQRKLIVDFLDKKAYHWEHNSESGKVSQLAIQTRGN